MSTLEHLIENGLCRLNEGRPYREWREIMQQDCNWEGNENITIDNLWEICQYVVFNWDSERTFVRCKDCTHAEPERVEDEIWCPVTCSLRSMDWFCADGERKRDG